MKGAYNGDLAPKSEKGYDVTSENGDLLQVKACAIDHRKVGSRTTSTFRSWNFHAMVIALLDPHDLSVGRATELTLDAVRQNAIRREYVKGWVLKPNDALMSQGTDVTEKLQTAALEL